MGAGQLAPTVTPNAMPFPRVLLPLAALLSLLASFLLFAFEPYIGKLLLPRFGGTPLVWNSCMAFFQVALLAGYAWALWLSRLRWVWLQAALQVSLLLAVTLVLPNVADAQLGLSANSGLTPLRSLGAWLVRHVGPTFVAVAALTTLIHGWYARLAGEGAPSAYRLYAASNVGSVLGLFAYPFLLEPRWALGAQHTILLVLLAVVATGVSLFAALLRAGQVTDPAPIVARDRHTADRQTAAAPRAEPLPVARLLLLAAAPSGMLLGVSTFLLTDIASIPLLWMVPLALYLGTFIVAFAMPDRLPLVLLQRITALAALVATLTLALDTTSPAWLILPLHLVTFTVASLLCHGHLARRAPEPARLPTFYLLISTGGAIGGLAALLIPPLVSDRLVEYPVSLILALGAFVTLRESAPGWRGVLLDVLVPLGLVVGGVGLLQQFAFGEAIGSLVLPFAPAALYALQANDRGPAFMRRLGAMYLASFFVPVLPDRVIFADRSFYGRVRVTLDETAGDYALVHGTTVHGVQKAAERDRCIATTYYHASGPAGSMLAGYRPPQAPARVGLIGVGAGALACYARPGETWDLFELDPLVARVAQDTTLFTFLARSAADSLTMRLGDARLSLERESAGRYGILVLDAFSSDAIPTHLLTREAFAEYRRVLAPDGMLLVHISNRFFDLQGVIAAAAQGAEWRAYEWSDTRREASDEATGRYPSDWMLLTPAGAALPTDGGWTPSAIPAAAAWSDDRTNLIATLRVLQRGPAANVAETARQNP